MLKEEVGYKVYLTENADDDNYSYRYQDTLSAKAGTTVEANAYTTKQPSGFDTQHFLLRNPHRKSLPQMEVIVITVKYSRNVYTITFEERLLKESPVLTYEGNRAYTFIKWGCYRLYDRVIGKPRP